MENKKISVPVDNELNATTQLEFKQAMQDFQIMFPDMDRDVIEEVLRANDGAVDATIDQLLTMSTDNLNETLRLQLEKVEDSGKYHNEKSFIKFPDVVQNKKLVSSPFKKWHPPLLGPLPPTFLRINNSSQKSLIDYGEDERIALFLQNEEFLSELRINPDFMNTLDQDVGERSGGGSDIEIFKERLRYMGKLSRNKFAQLSRVFQRRKKNRSAKGILDQSASGDSVLLGGEPLLPESSDEATYK